MWTINLALTGQCVESYCVASQCTLVVQSQSFQDKEILSDFIIGDLFISVWGYSIVLWTIEQLYIELEELSN